MRSSPRSLACAACCAVLLCLAVLRPAPAGADSAAALRVLRGDGFEVRIVESRADAARDASDVLRIVDHTLHPIDVDLEHARLSLEPGDRGSVTCASGPAWRVAIAFGDGTDAHFAFAAACGSRIEVVEEGTHWRR